MPTSTTYAVGYHRGNSRDTDAIRRHCDQHGLTLLAVHHDDQPGETGLQAAFRDLRDHPGSVALVTIGLDDSSRRDQRHLEAITIGARLVHATHTNLDQEKAA